MSAPSSVSVDHGVKSSMRPVGAHLSVAGGYEKGLERAQAVGADALQIFSGSPRVWARPTLNPDGLRAFHNASLEKHIRPLFVHALYLVNLAGEKTESVQKSVKTLVYELDFGRYFECAGLVVHLGSHQGRGWEAVKEQLAVLIQKCIDEADSPVPFLIENSAGQKGKIASDFAEIRWLLDRVNRPTLGWCYDTCHGWSAGYTATQTPKDGDHDFFAALERYDLARHLQCFHVNDSRDPYASGRDRHANIGEGSIPTQELQAILNHPSVAHVPIITEVPGLDGEGPDAENIQRIRALLTK